MEQAFTLDGRLGTFFAPEGGKLTIVLDRTTSMQHSIDALKDFLPKYIIRRAGMGIESLCLVTFDDHYRGSFYRAVGNTLDVIGPTDNLEEFMYGLSQVKLGDGADYPEAVSCALSLARKVHGGSIWLVTDSVPHGAGAIYDDPWLNIQDSFREGCPCGEQFDPSGVNVLWANGMAMGYDFWYQQTGGRVAKADLQEILDSDPLTSEMLTV